MQKKNNINSPSNRDTIDIEENPDSINKENASRDFTVKIERQLEQTQANLKTLNTHLSKIGGKFDDRKFRNQILRDLKIAKQKIKETYIYINEFEKMQQDQYIEKISAYKLKQKEQFNRLEEVANKINKKQIENTLVVKSVMESMILEAGNRGGSE